MTIHPGNLQCFLDCYAKHLTEQHKKHPEAYAWPESEMPQVLERMSGDHSTKTAIHSWRRVKN